MMEALITEYFVGFIAGLLGFWAGYVIGGDL
jgi:hypothetical protein